MQFEENMGFNNWLSEGKPCEASQWGNPCKDGIYQDSSIEIIEGESRLVPYEEECISCYYGELEELKRQVNESNLPIGAKMAILASL